MKSQWDFGDLFAKEPTRQVLSVSALTLQVKRLVEKQVGEVWVAGEITNLRAQASGHIYFTLKDSSAQIHCVLFRGEVLATRSLLKDGAKVLIQGSVTVYEPRGQFQLRVLNVELEGIGPWQLAFERLKQQLQAEGLFAPERKRPIPRYVRRMGIVTSSSGAALRDILHVIKRRHSRLEIILAACRVQGAGAGEEIACAIALLNEWSRENHEETHLDLILVTRGGGSLEDLWAFNEEVVARAIFHSRIPVVSAIGHEIDFTISDFVADLRAATPSVAAELITEGMFASRLALARLLPELAAAASRRLDWVRENLRGLRQRLTRAHPRLQINERWQRLDDLETALVRAVHQQTRQYRSTGEALWQRLGRVRPSRIIARRSAGLEQSQGRLVEAVRNRRTNLQQRLERAQSRLALLSPLSVLKRGYSITTDAGSGRVIRDATAVQRGQRLKTRLEAGDISSVAE